MRSILVALTAAVLIGVGVPTATAHGDHVVEIREGAFVPERLEVRAGDTVEWRNEGETPHTVTADEGAFDSGPLEPGSEFEVRLGEPGTYRYRSTAETDEGMVGVVAVLPADHSGSSGSSGEGGSENEAAGGLTAGGSSDGADSEEGSVPDGEAAGSSGSPESGTKPRSKSVGSGGPALAQAAAVAIQDDAFVPPRVEVDAGGTVVWQHAGQRPHTVTASNGSFDSGTLESGASFSQTFSQPGTYSYYCRFHGSRSGEGMAGVVFVRGAAGNDDGDLPATGEQAGGLAETGASVAAPFAAAVALLVAGFWAVGLSDSRRAARRR